MESREKKKKKHAPFFVARRNALAQRERERERAVSFTFLSRR
jgi:hypothetical protein